MSEMRPTTLSQATGLAWLESQIDAALLEDLRNRGDVTSLATIPENLQGTAELIVKQDGILAGIEWAEITGQRTTPPVRWEFTVQDGAPVHKGEVVANVHGPMRGILISERTALNGLGHLSGIASMAHRAKKLVEETAAQVIDTRKTMPGWRLAQKYAVLCGGGGNHRIGLYDEILIKENHIQGAGGIHAALNASSKWLKQNRLKLPVEIEVTSLEELEEAIQSPPDRILLDNFPPAMLRRAVEIAGGRCILEASGGITLENLREVAETGVHRISLGALTHSVKPLDLSLLVRDTSSR